MFPRLVRVILPCSSGKLPEELKDSRYFVNNCYARDNTGPALSVRLVDLELKPAFDGECLVESLVLLTRVGEIEHSIVGVMIRLPGGSHTVITVERARWPTHVGEEKGDREKTLSPTDPEPLGSDSDRIVTVRPRRSSWKPSHFPSLLKLSPGIPFPPTSRLSASVTSDNPTSESKERAHGPEVPPTSLGQHALVYTIEFASNPPTFIKFCEIAKHVSKSLSPKSNDGFSARDSVLFAAKLCMVTKIDCGGSEPRFNPKLKSGSVSPEGDGNIPFRMYTTAKKGTVRVVDHDNATFKSSVNELSRSLHVPQDIQRSEESQKAESDEASASPSEERRSAAGGDKQEDSSSDVESLGEVQGPAPARVSFDERAMPVQPRQIEELGQHPPQGYILEDPRPPENRSISEIPTPPTGNSEEQIVPFHPQAGLDDQSVTSPEIEWARAEAQRAREEAEEARLDARESVRAAMLEAQQARTQANAQAQRARAEAEQGRMEAQRGRAEGRHAWANGREAWANGRETWGQGRLTWADGRQTWADGRRAWAEGREVWASEREAWAADREAWADLEEEKLRYQNIHRR
ncbi:hypothetical protein PM082_006911 [Marasmius tenuissimus]|nr:hypothetical protein PM082_006911 [Marasmius tenuissimus]